MTEKVTLEGEKYMGAFRASARNQEYWTGSEYTEAKHEGYYYEGSGIIEDKKTGEQYFFAFDTPIFEKPSRSENYLTLEKAIVNFNQEHSYIRNGDKLIDEYYPKLIEKYYPRIIDLSLGNILLKIKNSKENIPFVETKYLSSEMLVEKGYCVGEKGKMHLVFEDLEEK